MYAERMILETDITGQLIQMPNLPPNKQYEAIFLVIADSEATANVRRSPHPDIAGKVNIIGNVFDSTPLSAWDLPK
ncbi:MAG: hypothetical protein Q8K83_07845 [Methylotenera sp.]|nr:hypothetical protein [Methylotenera sp.]